MKRTRKSLLLALNWVLLSFGTSLLIILTQPIAPVPAQEPAESVIIETTKESPSAPQVQTIPTPETNDSQSPEVQTEETPQSESVEEEPAPSPEEIARQQKLIEADKLYLAGQIAAAEKLYREVKEPFNKTVTDQERKAAILDPTQLSPAGKVYWRESEAGIANKLQTRTMVPLQLLVEQYPEFIPGHIRFAEVLKQYDRSKEALDVLERAASLYPNQPTLIKARISALTEQKNGWKRLWRRVSLLFSTQMTPKHLNSQI